MEKKEKERKLTRKEFNEYCRGLGYGSALIC